MEGRSRRQLLRQIVERGDLDQFTDRVLASFWERPEFQAVQPPYREVRAWVRWNLELMIRWLVEGRPTSDAELESFRESARARAADGTPADLIPANFRRGARFAWSALLDAASDEERPAVVESADLLFEYVDRVSRIFADAYDEASITLSTSAEERAARAMLDRLAQDQPLQAEDHQLAEQIGLALGGTGRPFVIVCPGRSAPRHMALAERVRRCGILAASEGRRVVGLSSSSPPPWAALELDGEATYCELAGIARGELGRALEDLRSVGEVAAGRGDRGRVELTDYLPQLLLDRSPRLAESVRARVYGPLQGEHAELARTLDVLVAHDFDRGRTAAALPVHRNTLRDRLRRVAELTGVDVECADGRGLVWLAWVQRGEAGDRGESAA